MFRFELVHPAVAVDDIAAQAVVAFGDLADDAAHVGVFRGVGLHRAAEVGAVDQRTLVLARDAADGLGSGAARDVALEGRPVDDAGVYADDAARDLEFGRKRTFDGQIADRALVGAEYAAGFARSDDLHIEELMSRTIEFALEVDRVVGREGDRREVLVVEVDVGRETVVGRRCVDGVFGLPVDRRGDRVPVAHGVELPRVRGRSGTLDHVGCGFLVVGVELNRQGAVVRRVDVAVNGVVHLVGF